MRGAALKENLITPGNFGGQMFPENLEDLPLFSELWNEKVKIMWHRVTLGLILNIFLFYLGKADSVNSRLHWSNP